MTIEIRSTDLDCLKKHTEACWPEEACALLVGRHKGNQHWIVNFVEPARNIAENPSQFFEIDPTIRIRLEMKTLFERNEIIGVFHSHPEGKATLSATDKNNIREPNLFWLIASTLSGKVAELCAFAVADDHNINQLTLLSTCEVNGD
ncbi:MAG: M67 family metallopeptidase [Sneathiella sp.]